MFDTQLLSNKLRVVAEKVTNNKRITPEEGLLLYEEAELGLLSALANVVRERKHGNRTYFNKNIHIEPTNICVYKCKFCSYSRRPHQEGAWEYSIDEMLITARKYKNSDITEIHIVGGVHPDRDLDYYCNLISAVKKELPTVHIKAFTAIELDYMIRKAGLSLKDGLLRLKESGLDSIPGGGAEIFDPEVRRKVCSEKSTAELWLNVHETAHSLNIPSNATILYGHIEKYSHRVDHLEKLRSLQDRTNGFNAFIPLKYRNKNNELSYIEEASTIEDLRNYAISRIYLDNIPHIKSYWIAVGKEIAQLSLDFGVDDIDGTIDDSTKIYTMAGTQTSNQSMTTGDMIKLIKDVNRLPIERDSVYNEIKIYK